ncbi:unnamed protein product [Ilex paraguariensis]|uniref:Uncharacterized protein n=1 Tax=Ilex paraguariensis TaxID=185542 RepID=A0ABC8TZK0_9AQUA
MSSPKYQALHSSFSQLKLSNNCLTSNQCDHQLGDSSTQQSPSPDVVLCQSPLSDSAPLQSLLTLGQSAMPDLSSKSRSSNAALFRSGFSHDDQKTFAPPLSVKDDFSFSASDHTIETSDKKLLTSDIDVAVAKEEKPKIYIRLRTKKKSEEVQHDGKTGTVLRKGEELGAKTWNLRPRKPLHKPADGNVGKSAAGGSSQENKSLLPRATGGGCKSTANKKEKVPKFSIALSPEEIEEDIFAMTGSKPCQKPKKRGKAVQKQLDNVFPGLWLGLITPSTYKVSEAPP